VGFKAETLRLGDIAVEVLGRGGLRYTDGKVDLYVGGEPMAGDTYLVYPKNIHSFGGTESVSGSERMRVLADVRAVLLAHGYSVEDA